MYTRIYSYITISAMKFSWFLLLNKKLRNKFVTNHQKRLKILLDFGVTSYIRYNVLTEKFIDIVIYCYSFLD